MDPLNLDAAVKELNVVAQTIASSINFAVGEIGGAKITIGPITIPAFTIQVETPSNTTSGGDT